jgi:cytochrome P450
MNVLGYPAEDIHDIDAWVEALAVRDPASEEGIAAGESLVAYITNQIQTRSSEPRTDLPENTDLFSAVMTGTVDGRPLDDSEKMRLVLLLTMGGLHTTTLALTGALVWLADHPEDRRRLREDPSLMRSAVEEFVRFTSPVAQLRRTVTKDTVLGGCPIPKGDRVLYGMASANRDPTHFERPDEVVLARQPNKHLAFGVGPHRCAGSHLAKLKLRVALEEFLLAMPDFHITDHAEIKWLGGMPRGMVYVPMAVGK